MTGLFWEIHQTRRIAEAKAAGQRGSAKALDAMREVRAMEDRIDKLALVCRAMWELLKENTDLTEEHLMARVEQIDLSDGRDDGKVKAKVQKCAKCDRTLAQRHKKCMYCGATRLDGGAFDVAT